MSNIANNNTFYNIIFDKLQLFGNKTKNVLSNSTIDINSNTQTIVITNSETTDENAKKQLLKILDACKIAPENVTIINHTPLWTDIKQKFSEAKNILLFGVSENDLGITGNWSINKIIPFDDKHWIKTVSIADLQNNNNLKAELWNNALKTLFIK